MAFRTVVIILTYNGKNDTLACLESLDAQGLDTFGIIVVDNKSDDCLAGTVLQLYPDVVYLQLEENRGWAGGNNAGIALAERMEAKFVCLLNNDTIIPEGTIQELERVASSFGICLLHPAIDYADLAEGAQLDPEAGIAPGKFHPADESSTVFDLEFAYGACLMIPMDVFKRIGVFDERFFLQLEETDFWLRARAIGIRSLCTTTARIFHAESKSFGGRNTPGKLYYTIRNSLLLWEKHDFTISGLFRTLRSAYWTIHNLIQRRSGHAGPVPLPLWLFSKNLYLVAARAGALDYLLRRFGRISIKRERTLRP